MAELFLQDFEPKIVARPEDEYSYDFLASFENDKGGINTVGVIVKATDKAVPLKYSLDRKLYKRLVHSNLPGLLLVVDVKQNKVFFWWPQKIESAENSTARSVTIPVTEADDSIKHRLRKRFVG
jgi:hypothetical protein